MISQNMQHPTQQDWSNAKRVLRYLKGTTDLGITYNKNGNPNLEAFSDSDWGTQETIKNWSNFVFCWGSH
jgi:hypothetical protein